MPDSAKKAVFSALIGDCLVMLILTAYGAFMGMTFSPVITALGFIVIFFLLFGLMW